MNQSEGNDRSVVIEKTFPHSPEKLWQAMTDPKLLAEWLLPNNFGPQVGQEFQFRNEPVGGWDGVVDCKILVFDAPHRLAYSWRALGLESIVQFTLTPTESGTHVRMEHSGFRADQQAAYQGARFGWQRFIGTLERLLSERLQ